MGNNKFVTLGEKVRGFSHEKNKTRCEDRYKIKELDKAVIVAVADGHGSSKCKYSQEGAQGAVEVFCDIFLKMYKSYDGDLEKLRQCISRNKTEVIPKRISKEWNDKVKLMHAKKRKNEDFNFELYGTTLLGMLLTDNFYFALQLGDGDMICVTNQEETDYVLKGEKLLGTETYSLSSKDSWKNMSTEVHFVENKEEYPKLFMISTDGYSNSFASEIDFLESGTGYLELIKNYGENEIKKNLKSWLKEISKEGCGDDIAVVLIAKA